MYTGNGRPDPRPSPPAARTGRPGSASPQRDDGVDGVRGPPDEVLTFPRLRRLELDELLGQLVERAQEVMGTQGRLRGLLRANQLIARDLGLPTVLRHVAEAARELVGARYAALGVIAPSGGLAQFVHVGMPAEVAAGIGHLPQGKGLLGALIDDPDPIRLRSLAEDPRSSGFPPGHPPMRDFLGVPIRIGEVVFGNLYLTESTRGGFSAEDEQLAQALAATAGTAIDNARLYEVARSRQQWWQATAALTRRMLTGETGDPLEFIAARTRELADADLVTVVLPADAPHGADETGLRVQVAVGVGGQELSGLAVPLAGSLAGRVYATGRPLRVSHPSEQPGLDSMASGTVDVGPVLVVPLTGARKVIGVLTVARLSGRAAFTTDELDMAAGFANQASVAIELAAARTEQQHARDRRRARPDRRGPARPRHPTAVRHRAGAAEHRGHPALRHQRLRSGRHRGRAHQRHHPGPRRHDQPDPLHHLRPAPSGPTRRHWAPRPDPGRHRPGHSGVGFHPRPAGGRPGGRPHPHRGGRGSARGAARGAVQHRPPRPRPQQRHRAHGRIRPAHPRRPRRRHRRRSHQPAVQRPGQPAPPRRTSWRRVHPHPAPPRRNDLCWTVPL